MNGRVSCLGPKGSFSERAAWEMRAEEVLLFPSFAGAVSALIKGEADFAVLPVENALGGGVIAVLDLLSQNDIFGTEEKILYIDHRLATLGGVKFEDIDAVYSHEQALLQCSEFLKERLPHAALIGTSSTAESLEKLSFHTAGIVGAHVRREGVVLSEQNIADEKGNFTRFLRVRRGGFEGGHSGRVFLCAECRHEPGSLLGLLQCFDKEKLNLTRIESRPVKKEPGHYRFFIEFTGDMAAPPVKRALSSAEEYCSFFKLLGAYE